MKIQKNQSFNKMSPIQNKAPLQQARTARTSASQEVKSQARADLGDGPTFSSSNSQTKNLTNAFQADGAGKAGLSPMNLRMASATDPLSSDACLDAFEFSSYTEADAKAAVEKFSFLDDVDDAMEYIGLKIQEGNESMLDEVGITRNNFDKQDCLAAFNKSGYSEADAKTALKSFDFLHTVDDAKEYIGLKIVNGYEGLLHEQGISESKFDHQDEMDAFYSSNYSDADAKKALKSFDFLHNLEDAKGYIGLKIINGNESMLKNIGVTQSDFDSQDMTIAFQKSNYSQLDAQAALDSFDFLNDIGEAREYIGLKLMNGTESILAEVGITEHPWDEHECLHAFDRSSYSNADARKASAHFDFLHSFTDAKSYIGLKIINGYESMMEEAGITQGIDRQDMTAAFRTSKYGKSEAKQAMQAFGFINSLDEAKEYIGLKVLNKTEWILKDAGIS